MITLLINPDCSKSNCALDYSKQFPSLQIQQRNYLIDSLSKDEIMEMVSKSTLPISDFVRTTDKKFIALFEHEQLPDEALIEALVHHPEFLQRPILIHENTVIIGRPPELILEYLKLIQ